MDRSPVKGVRGQAETEDAWPISKTDSQPILKVASLQWEAKENIMLFSQSGIWWADSVFGSEFEGVMLKRSTKSWRGNSSPSMLLSVLRTKRFCWRGDQVNDIVNMPANVIMPAKWSILWKCLASDQHRDNACQCCRIHRLTWHRGESHDKQHCLGWRWEIVWGNFCIPWVCLPLFFVIFGT